MAELTDNDPRTVPQEDLFRGLVLAAGLSQRMGDFKPLLPLRGKTLLENSVDSLLDSCASSVLVVTGYRADELESLLRKRYASQVSTVRNPNYATSDMLESIRVGCRALRPCSAFFLLPGDMPVVRKETFLQVRATWLRTGGIVFPTLEGYRKHPPLICREMIPKIISFQETGGLRQIWKEYESIIHTVAVDDLGVWVDLDTPHDYRRCVDSCADRCPKN